MGILKLQTNIPLIGTIEKVNFAPTKNPQYSDQILLDGKWDGAGEARVYLHLSVRDQLIKLGVIGQVTPNGSHPLLVNAPRVKITRTENGQSKITTVELLSSSGAAPQQPASAPTQGSLYNPPQQNTPVGITEQDIENTYEDCVKRVARVWIDQGGKQDDLIEQIAAGAHTMFIQRCQKNLYTKTESVPV